jgi:hypothetical protein
MNATRRDRDEQVVKPGPWSNILFGVKVLELTPLYKAVK